MLELTNSNFSLQYEARLKNVGDLKKQPYYIFLHYTYPLHYAALGVLLYFVGGMPFLVWGMVKPAIIAPVLSFSCLYQIARLSIDQIIFLLLIGNNRISNLF